MRPDNKNNSKALAAFFELLNSMGLTTTTISSLSEKVILILKTPDPNARGAASYHDLLERLTVPQEAANPIVDGAADTNLVSTVIHEFAHVSYDLIATKDAPAGSPGREHYRCVESVWSNLHAEKLIGVMYDDKKANEVIAEFMGLSFSQVTAAFNSIIEYNNSADGVMLNNMDRARPLDGELILPTVEDIKRHPTQERKYCFNKFKVFGLSEVAPTAFVSNWYGSTQINWDEKGQEWLKKACYNSILGLHPPKNYLDLLDRMNKADTPLMQRVRRELISYREACRGKTAIKECNAVQNELKLRARTAR